MKVINQELEREGFDSKRYISQIYYLIGSNYLNLNQPDSEMKAIPEFIKAVNILINHLSVHFNYDISQF